MTSFNHPRRGRLVLLRRVLCWTLSAAMLAGSLPAAAFAATTADPSPVSATASQYPPFLIGPGDLLNITVYGEKDLPTAFQVDSNGTIVFPMVGQMALGGLTQVDAGATLTTALAKYLKQPQVTVLVADSAQYSISVIGNVVKPGKYPIRGLPRLLSVISEAGGPLPHSDLNNAVLVRGNLRTPLALGNYLATSGNPGPEPVLYPGDVVYLPVSPWPTLGDWGIIASILTSAAVLASAVKLR